MNWYEYNKEYLPQSGDTPILNETTSIMLNDVNLKPDWVEHPALFTEFHVKRNSKDLVLVIGESWTYGEALPDIATAIQKYSIHSQLKNSFGPKLAVALNADYYQYAVPGNCNYYMFEELKRILEVVRKFNYDKIYLCLQMTEPAREKAILHKLKNHPIEQLYKEKINFKNWLEEYDNILFDQYDEILKANSDLNLDAILWKNFCKISGNTNDRLFKTVDTTWIQYSSRILGMNLEAPMFYSIDWLSSMYEHHKNINYSDKKFILDEIDKVELSNKFVKANAFHSHHPNLHAHLLWSQFILRKSGWIDGI